MPRNPSPAGLTFEALADGAAAAEVPDTNSLRAVAQAALGCRSCRLWERATQTVFGEGRRTARLVLVGEQPGDEEDLEGRPFVGPAGRLLDGVLKEAGIAREDAYVTNVVKHFKWEPKGKRRIHQRPKADEIDACGPWLAAELSIVRPQALVLLGATAAQALLGRTFRVTVQRGVVIEDSDLAPYVMATAHPSSVLRAPTSEARRAGRALLVQEFAHLRQLIEQAEG